MRLFSKKSILTGEATVVEVGDFPRDADGQIHKDKREWARIKIVIPGQETYEVLHKKHVPAYAKQLALRKTPLQVDVEENDRSRYTIHWKDKAFDPYFHVPMRTLVKAFTRDLHTAVPQERRGMAEELLYTGTRCHAIIKDFADIGLTVGSANVRSAPTSTLDHPLYLFKLQIQLPGEDIDNLLPAIVIHRVPPEKTAHLSQNQVLVAAVNPENPTREISLNFTVRNEDQEAWIQGKL